MPATNDVVVEMTEIEHAASSLRAGQNGANGALSIDGGSEIELQPSEQDEDDDELDSDRRNKDKDDVVVVDNCHKTYLLGIEGVAALRFVSVC